MASLGHVAVTLGLCCLITMTRGLALRKPVLHAPDISLVGEIGTVFCFVPDAPKTGAILYELRREHEAQAFSEYTAYDGHAANFIFKAKPEWDGGFLCEASVHNASAGPPAVSDVHYLRVIEPVKEAELVSDLPLDEVFEGRGLTLTCTLKAGTHVSYQWSHNGHPIRTPRHWSSGDRLHVTQAAREDAGNYSCLATNQLNDTEIYSTSDRIFIRVKVPVSKPEVSLTVHKGNSGYLANVTCRSDEGTPPVNFTFTIRDDTGEWQIFREGDPLGASFAVPIALNRREGEVHCEAANGDEEATSDELTLEVVPVNGTVTLTSQRVGSFFDTPRLALQCEVERGTLPRYRWFLNDSSLGAGGDFYSFQGDGQSLLLKSVTASSSGFYHCVAADSFDEMNSVTSEKLFVDKNALALVGVGVFAVVLSCFLFLLCLLVGCCVYGHIYSRRLTAEKLRPTFTIAGTDSLESEDQEPVEMEYMEDTELDSIIDCTEKDEEESVDEWPVIERALQVSCMDEEEPVSERAMGSVG